MTNQILCGIMQHRKRRHRVLHLSLSQVQPGWQRGVIDTSSVIDCTGIFHEVSNEPKCWIYPGAHGNLNVSEAIRDSCNVFFYTTGYRLSSKDSGAYDDASGISYIQKYASIYGLDQKTGLEIVERQPEIATQYPVIAQSDRVIIILQQWLFHVM